MTWLERLRRMAQVNSNRHVHESRSGIEGEASAKQVASRRGEIGDVGRGNVFDGLVDSKQASQLRHDIGLW
jgi:hypothetical protein